MQGSKTPIMVQVQSLLVSSGLSNSPHRFYWDIFPHLDRLRSKVRRMEIRPSVPKVCGCVRGPFEWFRVTGVVGLLSGLFTPRPQEPIQDS